MRKICVVLTARTSYTKIKPVLQAIKDHPELELQLVCGASAVLERYGNADKIAERDGFPINERIHMVLEGETLLTSVKSAGYGVVEFAAAFDRLKPDMVFIMADRYETLAASMAAAYLNIPLAHAQGGEVSGNIDEKVRHANTKLADLHFPCTERAHDWIIRMGEDPEAVHLTGCPSIDIASDVLKQPDLGFSIYEKYGGVGHKPDLSNGYIIVMQHPVTTEVGNAAAQIRETLYAARDCGKPVLWFWPNADAGSDAVSKEIRIFRESQQVQHMHFFKNMEPQDFLRLLNGSDGIVGNSSVAIRECSYLGVPAVNLGTRQQNRERGPNVMDCAYDRAAILHAMQNHCGRKFPSATTYGDGHAAKKIAQAMATAPLRFSKTLHYT